MSDYITLPRSSPMATVHIVIEYCPVDVLCSPMRDLLVHMLTSHTLDESVKNSRVSNNCLVMQNLELSWVKDVILMQN